MEKLYQNRDWLYEHYIVREESTHVMAKEAECGNATILGWLYRYGIPVRTRGKGISLAKRRNAATKLYQKRDWLYEHYIVREESSPVMAEGVGCTPATIYRCLRKNNIPVRSRGEGVFLVKRNSVIIISALRGFMKGELLGDGCVSMPGTRSAYYQHSSAYEEYLIWLSGRFNEWGIEQVGRITDHISKKTGTIYYNYASRSYPELIPLRKSWYPNGKKIVPRDLKLAPIMVRQWYLGDGYLAHPKRGRPYITFATQGFDKESVEYLVEELGRLGFKATRQPSDNRIHLSVHSVQDFLKWIGPCPISCYDYKWDYSKEISPPSPKN